MKTVDEAWLELVTDPLTPVEPWFREFYEGRLYPWWMIGGAKEGEFNEKETHSRALSQISE